MRIVPSVTLSVLITINAYSDSFASIYDPFTVKLENVSAPVYDGDGKELKGCILHADKSVLGYTTEESLCKKAPGSDLYVRVSRGECDTGRDHGDVECVARTKPFLGIGSVHGNGRVVHSVPAKPQ